MDYVDSVGMEQQIDPAAAVGGAAADQQQEALMAGQPFDPAANNAAYYV